MTTVINICTQRGQYFAAQREGKYVYIGRVQWSCGPWGNKYTHVQSSTVPGVVLAKTRETAIERHKQYVLADPELVAKIKCELKNKVLGCWCHPAGCHGHTLAAIANGELG